VTNNLGFRVMIVVDWLETSVVQMWQQENIDVISYISTNGLRRRAILALHLVYFFDVVRFPPHLMVYSRLHNGLRDMLLNIFVTPYHLGQGSK
jgi:hypothetical protein